MHDDDEEEDVTPQQSRCWTCRHGMTLQENDVQIFMQPEMIQGNPFDGDNAESPGVSQISIDIQKVRSVCFWRSQPGQSIVSPLVFNVVTECSRYEKN